MTLIRRTLIKHRRGIGLTYGLTVIENGFDLLYPFAIGLAVNSLIEQRWFGVAPLGLIWLMHTASGYLRQRFDTRLFTRIYTQIASDTVVRQRREGESVSEIAARTDMAEELVEFMESDIPAMMLAAFGVIGGAGMLFYYDPIAGLLMGSLVPVTVIAYLRFGRRAYRMEGHFNDRSETEVDVIRRAGPAALTRHFRQLSRWRVRISDAEARTWSGLELLALPLFIGVLIRLTSLDELMTGGILAAVAYCVRMLDALDRVPDHIGQLSRMADNLRRLD